MFKRFVKLMNDSKGATAIEYGLIAALIAVAAIGAMRGIGTKLSKRLIRRIQGGGAGDGAAAFVCAAAAWVIFVNPSA